VTNVVSALNNIALIQFLLGMAKDSLKTYNKSVDLLKDASPNILAHILANRGSLLSYLGDFSEAKNDFEDAFFHFDDVGDAYGIVETLLAWGYEYHAPLGKWALAQQCYEKARHYIDDKPDVFYEAKVRFLLGYGQLLLKEKDFHQAMSVLIEAEDLAKEKSLIWWLSAIEFYHGCVLVAESKIVKAKIRFTNVVELVSLGASPDYLPLALREMSRIEINIDDRIEYALRCGNTVLERGRFIDRVECLRYVSILLNEVGHEKSKEYLKIAGDFRLDQKKGNETLPF